MEIIVITDYRGFLRQHIKQYKSLDKDRVKRILSNQGFHVEEYTYEEIVNGNINIENKKIIYTSCQDSKYKKYIDDVLYYLSKKNTLIPRYEIFKAHENKGFQELLKKEIGIKSLEFMYFGNKSGLVNNKGRLNTFPVVLKKVDGAGSSNVHKVESCDELFSLVQKLNKPLEYRKYMIKKILKKYFFKSKYIEEYYGEDLYMGQFVLQEFVHGLCEDWKVLIFSTKYYVLNRKVRENDFRASGSGKLAYVEPPKQILDYAKCIFEKLDVPFVSLDIAYNGNECSLIEFQGTHFGPYTIVNSDCYYEYKNNRWIKVIGKSNLEEEYSLSIIDYFKEETKTQSQKVCGCMEKTGTKSQCACGCMEKTKTQSRKVCRCI
jgi:hypothetical protein